MDQKRILKFLRQVMANNNREWFQEHKNEYEAIRAEFELGVRQAIDRITTFDKEIAHVQVKDCTYRFYRDTRFSLDKSPYKNHLGAYINAKSKKALRGGYYLHLEPDHCLLAVGNYWLPTSILTSCRNEIMANTAEWLRCVKNKVVAAPEFTGYLGADYRLGKWLATLGLKYIGNLYTAVGDAETKENFCLLNASVTYAISHNVSLGARGENLLAQKYEINLGYPMPRATFMGGVSLNF